MSQSPNEAGRHNFVVVLWRQMKVNWFKEIAHGGGKAARQLGGQVAVAIGTPRWQWQPKCLAERNEADA